MNVNGFVNAKMAR